MFEFFNLTLPKGTNVQRLEKSKIKIETDRFIMNIVVIFRGVNSNVPDNFLQYYMFIDDLNMLSIFEIKLDIEVYLKFGKLFSRTGWEYYQWIDLFLDKMEEYFSIDKFFNEIGWNQNLTLINYLNKVEKKEKIIKEEILIEENFEKYEVGKTPTDSWKMFLENESRIIITNDIDGVLGSKKCLKIISPINSNAYIKREFQKSIKLEIEYYLRQEIYYDGKYGTPFIIESPKNIKGGIGNRVIYMDIKNGYLRHCLPAQKNVCEIKLNKWYYIKILINCEVHEYVIKVNENISEKGNFDNKFNYVNAIRTKTWGAKREWSTYIDKIKIRKIK